MTDTRAQGGAAAAGGDAPELTPRQEAAMKGMIPAYWAKEQPDKTAIISGGGDRTFAELNSNANRLVRALRRRGVQAGDSVALICGNVPAFPETVAACQRAGLRLTPINWHLTGDEAAYIVGDCEAKALIAEAPLAEMASGAVRDVPTCIVRLAVGGPIEGFESYEESLATEADDDIEDPSLGGTMLYTSGTTGRPKGVHRPAATRITAVMAGLNPYGYKPGEDMHLCTGPLYHAAPLAFSLSSPLSNGVGVVLMGAWDAEETLRLIAEHRVTHTHMVPTMFHRLLSLPEDVRAKYDLSSLRHVLHGAAPCPVPVKKALIDWLGPIVFEYYAATEGAGTSVDSATWLERPGTVGKVNPPDHVKIGDDEGNPLPTNEVGLVFLKAPDAGRFQYYKDEDKTSSAYRGNYFTLGDVGYVDDDGYLYLTDRTANLIISGGVNIYPAEVDAVLLTHPAVGDVATIGVPNDEWGEEVKAVVELKEGVEPTPELATELVEFCRQKLARFKCPRSVDFIDTLPRQDNGKIYKRLLRDRYRTGS
ncbi:MAG TPA: AMP-binding protein [Acidimicrobiales bacterium]|nr:AMP-binding protein [Acidimicrobiales bacterium]